VNRQLLVVDTDAEARDALVGELRAAGYEPAASVSDALAAIVVRVGDEGLPPSPHAVPVIAVVDEGDAELRLRSAIAGAVQCVPRDRVIEALRLALAPDAPSLAEQQRRARVSALEAIARGSADTACRVHLTRLERRPVRPAVAPASPLAGCTPKQRELLGVIARAGSVSNAAVVLGASRGTIYATLRRIAHRLHLRDSGELLRIIGADNP
jgi:DNA-binding CsgD family transcriptional regulator